MSSQTRRDVVIVIDDDPDLRSLVVMLGRACDVPVLEAENCSRGLELLEQEHSNVKLVLLDYFMPGTEPSQCVARIVAKAGPSIPVVLLTAAVDAAERAAGVKIDRWISKPFETATLMALLRQSAVR